jgi:hypothetical protein
MCTRELLIFFVVCAVIADPVLAKDQGRQEVFSMGETVNSLAAPDVSVKREGSPFSNETPMPRQQGRRTQQEIHSVGGTVNSLAAPDVPAKLEALDTGKKIPRPTRHGRLVQQEVARQDTGAGDALAAVSTNSVK